MGWKIAFIQDEFTVYKKKSIPIPNSIILLTSDQCAFVI